MDQALAISEAVAPVVERWLSTCPGVPLVLRADPNGGVECTIGLGDSSRITGAAAADILGVSSRTWQRHSFFGLRRGIDGKFSRLQVNNLKQRRAG